ncbi:MAG: gentisate 1,2-dioxygenase [Bryobacterales bacterium]|nr:gentisate 1,2-dioxygenase [Bryobacterales bacterium]
MGTSAFFAKPETSAERREYYQRLEQKHAAPLWEVLGDLIPAQPRPTAGPALWRYQEMRSLLLEAGRLITAKEAERRVLILENPSMPGTSLITQSVYAGLQMVLPGETTSTHRHATSALRFVIESDQGYTAVDGERTTMHPGDFVLTPSWMYHDHGNPGDTPVVWLDGLDIPIVNLFGTSFAESYPGKTPDELQPVTKQEGDAEARYGQNLLPLEYKPSRLSSPVFNYSYARSRDALDQLYRNGPLHACHGVKMQYANPATGGYPMPTIGAFLQLLPTGFRGAGYRSTDAAVYCVAEGAGRSKIGDTELDWRKNDVFVVPSWYPVSHQAQEESVLFSFSDRPAQKVLGLWREEVVQN